MNKDNYEFYSAKLSLRVGFEPMNSRFSDGAFAHLAKHSINFKCIILYCFNVIDQSLMNYPEVKNYGMIYCIVENMNMNKEKIENMNKIYRIVRTFWILRRVFKFFTQNHKYLNKNYVILIKIVIYQTNYQFIILSI